MACSLLSYFPELYESWVTIQYSKFTTDSVSRDICLLDPNFDPKNETSNGLTFFDANIANTFNK